MDESRVQAAMQIIIHAGDARTKCQEALDSIAVYDFANAKEKLEASQKDIKEAHRIHTDVLQKECADEISAYTVLFAHAQDTLMTINSEIIIAKQMVKIFESYEERIARLEGNMKK